MISMDNAAKREHFMQLLEIEGQAYFWAGGRLTENKDVLNWENGKAESVIRGRLPWSHAGSRGPQPDGINAEYCLAVLNNFYQVSLEIEKVNLRFDFRMESDTMISTAVKRNQR